MPGTIARMNAALTWDLDDFDRGTSRIEGAFARIRDVALNLSDSFLKFGRNMTLGITAPLAALSYFSVKASSDAAELQSAFDITFGKMSDRMNKWAEETGDAMGRSTSEMQQGALTMGQLFNQSAPTAEAAADLSQSFAQLAQDAGSFNNTGFEEALNRIRSGLTGEAEPLRKFGVFLNEAAVKAKALELGMITSGQALNEQGKIMARAVIIREKMIAVDGDAIRTAGGFENQLRALKAEWSEFRQEIGDKVKPLFVGLIKTLRRMVQWLKDLPDGVKNVAAGFVAFAAAIGPVVIALTALAVTILPLFITSFGPVFAILSAILNPVGSAIVLLAKFAGGWGIIGTVIGKIIPIFLRLLGPIGLAIALIIFFKDDIIKAFKAVWEKAQKTLGPPLRALFGRLKDVFAKISDGFEKLKSSSFGKFLGELIKLTHKLVQKFLEFQGAVVIAALYALIDILDGIVQYVSGVIDIVTKLFEQDWRGAWESATKVVGSAMLRISRWISVLAPQLAGLLNMFGKLMGGSLEVSLDAADVDAAQTSGDGKPDALDVVGGNYALAGSGRKGRGRGRSGPSEIELAARKIELADQLALDIARESGDIKEERRLERKLELSRLIADFENVGLATKEAEEEAGLALGRLEAARAIATEKAIEDEETRLTLQLAQIMGNHETVRDLEDQEYVAQRIVVWNKELLDLEKAKIRANEDLALLKNAEQVRADKLYKTEERRRQIELARLRGDSDSSLRRLEEKDRVFGRFEELRQGGASDVDAKAQAIQEAMDRSKAHLQGTFRDTFRGGLQAAMNGNLGSFFENWFKEKSFNALSKALDLLADSFANLLSGINGKQGWFGRLLGLGTASAGLVGGGGAANVLTGGSSGDSVSGDGGPAALPVPFASGGSFQVKGIKGIDKNLLSINGRGVANVSHGEIVNIKKGASGGGGDGGGGGITVSIPITIDATGADPAALARTNQKLDELKTQLPGQIIETVADAQSRFVLPGGG